jgi:GNAT superfamily N-acetyltransferase
MELIRRGGLRDEAFNDEFSRAMTALRRPAQRPEWSPIWKSLVGSRLCPARALWLAQDHGETVGTIGASMHRPGIGYFGFYRIMPGRPDAAAVGALLLDAAERWLRSRRARRALGPVCLSTWFPYRVRMDADPRCFAWEPAGDAALGETLRLRGYAVETEYHTLGVDDLGRSTAQWRAALAAAMAGGTRFERVPAAAITDRTLRDVHGIVQLAFCGSYLFDPLRFMLFRKLYVPSLGEPSVPADLFLARDPGGAPLGFLFTFCEGEALVFKTTAVLPRAQGRRLSFALMAFAAEEAVRISPPPASAIFALVRNSNTSRAYTLGIERTRTDLWWHRYALYARSLS